MARHAHYCSEKTIENLKALLVRVIRDESTNQDKLLLQELTQIINKVRIQQHVADYVFPHELNQKESSDQFSSGELRSYDINHMAQEFDEDIESAGVTTRYTSVHDQISELTKLLDF